MALLPQTLLLLLVDVISEPGHHSSYYGMSMEIGQATLEYARGSLTVK